MSAFARSVLVQREMESWRVPLASITLFSAGQFGTTSPNAVAAGGTGGDWNCNWFRKGDQVGWSHSPRGALDIENQLVTKRISNIRAARHVNKQACRSIRQVQSFRGRLPVECAVFQIPVGRDPRRASETSPTLTVRSRIPHIRMALTIYNL